MVQPPRDPDSRIRIETENQALWARKWFSVLAFIWIAVAIMLAVCVLLIAIYAWVKGTIPDIPNGVVVALSVIAGGQGLTGFFIRPIIRHWFPGRKVS